jgi:hypothetical protein
LFAVQNAVTALLSEDSPNRINFDKHSSFTDRTHLSANAFRFGLLAGNFSGFTPPAFNTLHPPRLIQISSGGENRKTGT